MNDFLDLLKVLAFMAVLMFVTVTTVVVIDNGISAYKCRNYETKTGIETQWVTFDSCYLNTGTGWQRWDEYLARAVTNEGDKR